MISRVTELIRKRSREGWAALGREQATEARLWIQEHGELSFAVGVVAGLVIVLAFRLVLGLLVLSVLAGLSVWLIALPESGASYEGEAAYDPKPDLGDSDDEEEAG